MAADRPPFSVHRPPLAAPKSGAGRASGFTLLELLAVITIIAILAGIVIGVGRRASEAGKTARAKAELAALSAALESYKRTYGDYPQTDDSAQFLQALIGRRGPTSSAVITGHTQIESAKFVIALPAAPTVHIDPFTTSTAQLIDPWEQPYRYVYKVPAGAGWTNSSYVLYSIGPDGNVTPGLLTGGFPDVAGAGNTDNIYANRN